MTERATEIDDVEAAAQRQRVGVIISGGNIPADRFSALLSSEFPS